MSLIAKALPHKQALEFSQLACLQRCDADWMVLRARLYQALAVKYCEYEALTRLAPLDELLKARPAPLPQASDTRWRWWPRLPAFRQNTIVQFHMQKNIREAHHV